MPSGTAMTETQIAQIKYLHDKGESANAISRKLKFNRETVTKYIKLYCDDVNQPKPTEEEKKEIINTRAAEFDKKLQDSFEQILDDGVKALGTQLRDAVNGETVIEAQRLSTIIGTIYDKRSLLLNKPTAINNVQVARFEDL